MRIRPGLVFIILDLDFAFVRYEHVFPANNVLTAKASLTRIEVAAHCA